SGPTALAVTSVNANCGIANGTVTIGAVTGGVAPYSYSFNGSGFTTTTNYTGVAAGTYTVIVRDINNCQFTTTIVVGSTPGPTALAVTSVNSTCGLNNGVINVGAVTGGSPSYVFSVNGSPFTATTSYPGFGAGTYTVIVRDINNCTFTTTITITNIPGPTAQATSTVNSTCGAANGTVNVGATTGGTSPYLYSFNGGAFSSTVAYTGLTAGTYTVTVQDANGCTFTVNPIVVNTPGPIALASTIVNSSCGLANGVINLGATTGGTPAYTYSFNAGGFTTTTSYTGLTAGTYTITVKDANGCLFTINPVVGNTAGPTALASSTTSSTCGGANGSITLGAVTGGTAPYTYSVNGSPFTGTTTYTGLVANTYPIIVQDANGCQFTTSATVADLSGLIASITAQINVSCFGGSNGSVTVTASGSTAPYSYSFNGGPFGESGTFGTLTAGTYTITARDANSCTLPVTVTITQPIALSGSITSQTNVGCFGGSTGSVTVSATGGTPGYMYSINGGAFGASATFNTLPAGTHTVTVRDANNCTFNITVTITQPPALTLTTTSTNATCTASNGSATVTPAGGTPAYTYLWNSPAGATAALNNGIPAGNYSVLVTDANGCSQTAVVSVGVTPGGPATISSSTNASCAGSNDGTATVSMGAGSTPPFTYAWTPTSQTTVTAVNLAPAGYTVTVTDGNGCIATASVVITQPTIISNAFTMAPVSCFGGNNGILTSTPSGGTPGYSHFWTPGGFTTPTITTLTAGTYTLVITDANGCTRTVSTNVTQPTGMNLTTSNVSANCNLSNGSASVSVSGGTGPYTYLWNDPSAQTTATATGLPSNTYGVTVTDANGCTQTTTVTIADLAGPVATIFSSNNVSCNGDNDGSATVTVSGGTSPYTFSWTNGQMLPTATNLTANTYTVTATDMNGCIASTSVIITEPTLLDASIVVNYPNCFNSCDGSINSVAIGGVPPYSYIWSPGAATTPVITSLCAGTYTLQVTDANGCIVSKIGTLVDPAPVTATTTVSNVTCSGLCNGTATANPSSGTGPFTYQWNDINAQTTQTATGLCAGTYTVTVTDANGCSANAFATVISPGILASSITGSGNVTCFGACDGFASATVTGGSAPFSYNWMPGSTAGASVNNLCAATYTVTVTDANGCSASSTVTISEPVALVATISSVNVDCFGACNGAATAVYTGGTGPYTFQWTPTFQTTPTITNICAGIHNLAVTDANGCTATASVVITEPSALTVSTTTTNSNCGNADGQACAAITGGVFPFTYLWNDPASQTSSCANSINAGVYSISVTDANGCSVTGVANVNDNTAPVVTITSSNDVTCGGAANGDAQATITGGILPYAINWIPGGQTTAFISGLSGGVHSIVVTDGVGCVGTASVTINEPATLVSGITATSNASCFLSCDGTATVNAGGGSPPYTYLWNDPATQTTNVATGLCAQGYTVTITDANGCISTSTTTITQPSALNIALVNSTNVSCNSGNNGAITVLVTGGSPGYTYLWTPGVGSGAMVTGLTAGTYTVLVTDQNGCSNTQTYTITQPTALTLSTISNPSTCGNSNGFVSVTPAGGVPAYSYQWNDPTNQTTAIATNLAAGTYTVVVTDQNGCTADTSVVLNNLAGPTISGFSITEPLCYEFANGSVTVLPIGGQPGYSYVWTGTGSQTTQTASALPAGTYSVTVTDANGCTVTGSTILTQPSVTQVIVSPTDTICIGQNAQIYGAGYGGTPGYTYSWSPFFMGAGPHTVTPVLTTFYSVFVTDANGCVSPTINTTVFVNPALTVNATDVSVCDGSSVLISASATGGDGGPYTYTWSNAVTGSSQTVSPGISASPMDYIVTVDDGCSFLASDTATVTVNPQAVSFMNANAFAGCEDFQVTFTGLSNIGTSYSWNFGDGSSPATGSSVIHTYTTPGTYDVTLTVTTALGCTSTITSLNYIDVYASPTAEFSSSPLIVTSTSPTVTFTDLSLGAVTWDWDFVHQSPYTGLYTDTLQNTVYMYSDTGTYEVQLIVTNSFGCSDTMIHFVEIVPEYVFYAPNAFTPNNNDGINDLFMPVGTGINVKEFEMTIYDRWGLQIFKTTDVNKGWDGRANGGSKLAQQDVYVWKVITKDYTGDSHEYIGHITIIK
ncbi:MAG: PKD domain-containing protein, partial [Bacteroidota bacterium]|nr:PKD domain-containing protein [Bacteroidota bacterium]